MIIQIQIQIIIIIIIIIINSSSKSKKRYCTSLYQRNRFDDQNAPSEY